MEIPMAHEVAVTSCEESYGGFHKNIREISGIVGVSEKGACWTNKSVCY